MTDTERKALALSIEVREDARMRLCPDPTLLFGNWEALCRAIEQHEAFQQEVSDAVESRWMNILAMKCEDVFSRFIIAKPDPLVEAWNDMFPRGDCGNCVDAEVLRAAIEKRGGRIIFDGSGA